MGIDLKDNLFWSTFTIFIQIGAIFAVIVYFRGKLLAILLPGRRIVAQTPLEISAAARLASTRAGSSDASIARPTLDYAREDKPGDRRAGALNAIVIGTLPVLVIGYIAQKTVQAH